MLKRTLNAAMTMVSPDDQIMAERVLPGDFAEVTRVAVVG